MTTSLKTLLALVAVAFLATACAAPEVKEEAAPKPPPTIAKVEAPKGINLTEVVSNGEPTSLEGCPYVSPERREVACWQTNLEMGFGDVKLEIWELDNTVVAQSWELNGRADGEDDWTNREDNLKLAQAHIDSGKFVETTWAEPKGKTALRQTPGTKGIRIKGTKAHIIPTDDLTSKSEGKRAETCCKWMVTPLVSAHLPGLAFVDAMGDCDWVDQPGHACHVADYNDESYSYIKRRLLYTPNE